MHASSIALWLAAACGALQAQSYEVLFEQAAKLSARGDYTGAIAKYEAALDLRPGAVEALSNVGVMYYMNRRYREAADVMRKVLESRGGSFPAQLLLGLSLVRLEKGQDNSSLFFAFSGV